MRNTNSPIIETVIYIRAPSNNPEINVSRNDNTISIIFRDLLKKSFISIFILYIFKMANVKNYKKKFSFRKFDEVFNDKKIRLEAYIAKKTAQSSQDK